MNENIKEQGNELVADIRHALEWARREHGDAGHLALRQMLLGELMPGQHVVTQVADTEARAA